MTEEWFQDPQATRRQLAGDPHRPLYHFLPPRNWMNDPNGLFYWQDRFHLFYQFNPYRPVWGFIHWGHASSPDLIHWEDHPLALQPTAEDGDANGCWSGCLVDDQGVPTAVYTGFVDPTQTPVILARAQDPGLLTWQKSPHNPLLEGPPEGVKQTDFRDPYVWCEDGVWKMILGAGLESGAGAVLLYHSHNLLDWDYQGPLFSARTRDAVQMWECPNFFPLGDRFVLLVSLFPGILGVYFYVGDYDGRSFRPQTEGFLTESPFFYAPQVRQLKDDRMIMFGWLLEGREDEALEDAGWAGVQSLPQELSLDEEGRLVSRPVLETHSLRGDGRQISILNLAAGEKRQLPVTGRHLEVALTVDISDAELCLDVLASPDGKEKTSLRLNSAGRQLEMDLRQSSCSEALKKPLLVTALPETQSETVSLRVFIDGSVIETWVDDRHALTGRAYPGDASADGLFIAASGAKLTVKDLKIWKMKAIWPQTNQS